MNVFWTGTPGGGVDAQGRPPGEISGAIFISVRP